MMPRIRLSVTPFARPMSRPVQRSANSMSNRSVSGCWKEGSPRPNRSVFRLLRRLEWGWSGVRLE